MVSSNSPILNNGYLRLMLKTGLDVRFDLLELVDALFIKVEIAAKQACQISQKVRKVHALLQRHCFVLS
jgi:hypothetical protein